MSDFSKTPKDLFSLILSHHHLQFLHLHQDLKNHHDEIKSILEGEIAARYYFQKGRLEASFKNDPDVINLIANKVTIKNNAL